MNLLIRVIPTPTEIGVYIGETCLGTLSLEENTNAHIDIRPPYTGAFSCFCSSCNGPHIFVRETTQGFARYFLLKEAVTAVLQSSTWPDV